MRINIHRLQHDIVFKDELFRIWQCALFRVSFLDVKGRLRTYEVNCHKIGVYFVLFVSGMAYFNPSPDVYNGLHLLYFKIGRLTFFERSSLFSGLLMLQATKQYPFGCSLQKYVCHPKVIGSSTCSFSKGKITNVSNFRNRVCNDQRWSLDKAHQKLSFVYRCLVFDYN